MMMINHPSSFYLTRHETYLNQLMSIQDFPSSRLKDAMCYALFPGGKRLRPLLVYFTGELLLTNLDCLDIIAAAIELTHCYSLVHDDLPAMDNDDFRRGKPSSHRAFDEATAILTGDALQIFAIDLAVLQQHQSLTYLTVNYLFFFLIPENYLAHAAIKSSLKILTFSSFELNFAHDCINFQF